MTRSSFAPPVVEHRAATAVLPPLEIHRSPRRRRTGHAAARSGRIIVRVPAGMSAASEQELVSRLVAKVVRSRSIEALGGDEGLAARADTLADTYLDGVRASEVRWSRRMAHRYGSCTPGDGTIRISDRLAEHPSYVLDYILVHELAHLRVAHHTAAFRELVARFPEAERARGFLEGHEAGQLAAARLVDPTVEETA
ncbi:MAG: M48 family metallopeptidase [Nitriliruptoraceae bacterium]